ncbi:MAG: glucosamine-6-phosphate deaminase [Armatimonadetes bacterium]|nr:glucosamine-6-phosphate deaminase [Armatimonadota bacterium]MDW8122549.1 glucosamine-6-phosphate deaminase [Armatimonadota bacterium]
MEVIIVEDEEQVGKLAAQEIARLIRRKPNCVLGLATGSTPIPCYKELIRLHQKEGLDFSRVTTFNLDEYYPIDPRHEQSYRYFMNVNLFDHLNIDKARTFVPDGMAPDPYDHCKWYEEQIKLAGGIDLQILGIGHNGHIAFNEPGSSLASRTRVKTLTEETIRANSRFFERPEDVPRYAITMGIGTILEARKIVLLATGAGKAEAIRRSIEGPVTSMCPASALQLHPRVTYLIDEAAASRLEQKEYYKYVYQMAEQLKKKILAIV